MSICIFKHKILKNIAYPLIFRHLLSNIYVFLIIIVYLCLYVVYTFRICYTYCANKKALCRKLHRAFRYYSLLLCYVFFYCIHAYKSIAKRSKRMLKYTLFIMV